MKRQCGLILEPVETVTAGIKQSPVVRIMIQSHPAALFDLVEDFKIYIKSKFELGSEVRTVSMVPDNI